MLRSIVSICALILLALPMTANAQNYAWDRNGAQNYEQIPQGQRQVLDALENKKGLHFVEVSGVEVVKLLPDDNKGSKHQKWEVALANGRRLTAVYNTSICDRVPLKVGDVISMGGQFIYDRQGGLIHWLHEDPRGSRPDGYVEVNGRRYGDVVRNNRNH